MDNFMYSNFNYCFLVWHFCSWLFSIKIENSEKRWIGHVLNDYEKDCAT